MVFEFDSRKSLQNLSKHGIDFEEAQKLWIQPSLTVKARTEGEPRWALIAEWKDQYWTAIFTIREERIRIISVRKARDDEKEIYKKKI